MKKEALLTMQGGLAVAGAWLSDKLGLLYPVMILLMLMMVIDYISGLGASAQEAAKDPANPDKGWSSKKGKAGIFKKVGYMLVIAVAMAVDWIIFNAAGSVGIEVPTSTFFGLLTAVWFILNELLSILENAGRMGVPLPDYLKAAIAVLKSSVENKGNEQSGKK